MSFHELQVNFEIYSCCQLYAHVAIATQVVMSFEIAEYIFVYVHMYTIVCMYVM